MIHQGVMNVSTRCDETFRQGVTSSYTMTFLWAMAFMPIFVLSAIWGINELAAYLERRKKKLKMQCSYVKYRILKPCFYVKYRVLHIFFVSLDAN